ncbi:MAG: hypothetical protein ABSF23_09290 [Terracidiphilus sp.]
MNSFKMSFPSSLNTELLEDDELESELVCGGGDGGVVLSSVVSALCADEMSLSASAVETEEMNCPIGLLASAFAGVSFSNWARYVFAELVSPDLIAAIRLESAESKAFLLVEEAPETDVVEDSSERSELL